jgi:subtilisin family serine protease
MRRAFERVPAFAADVDALELEALAAHPAVLRVDLDEGGSGHLAESGPLAGVNATLAAGLLGQGTKIAVIDSGIDTDHPE